LEDHVEGPLKAEVTLLQYGDYECPYTRLSRHSIRTLQRDYPDSLRFVFRHFPLEEIHPHARAAAAAAEAAGAQGKFWVMTRSTSGFSLTGSRATGPRLRLLGGLIVTWRVANAAGSRALRRST
jgi:hypothetical protein